MKKNDLALICILFLLAFALRFYDLSYPDFRWADENAHVPAATNYWSNGQSEPDNWEHPPLRHMLEYLFLQLFGDNPYGWRMRNVLFGSLAAVLTYLFTRHISGDQRAALMAGLLLATDPLHITLSRYTYDEVYGSAFFLGAVVLFMKNNGRSSRIMLSALFAGVAIATKWYFLPGWLLLWFLALCEGRGIRDLGQSSFVSSVYLFIPLSVYLLSYYPWFGRGYGLREFLDYTVNAYYSLQSYRPQGYSEGMIFLSHISAGEWFIRPVIVGQGTYIGADQGEFIVYMNNLPIWILTLPSMVFMAVAAVQRRSVMLALPVLFFFANYLLFIVIRRPVFIYSAAPLLPFAFAAVAYALSRIVSRSGQYGARLFYAALAIMIAWNLYLYPLATAKKVSAESYRYILSLGTIKTH